MRVERLEHAVDGSLDQPVGGYLTDIVVLDGAKGRREDLVLPGKLILGDHGLAAEQPADQRTEYDDEHRR
jgi:hypothetical protein